MAKNSFFAPKKQRLSRRHTTQHSDAADSAAKQPPSNKSRLFFRLLLAVSACVFLFSAYKLTSIFIAYKASADEYSALSELAVTEPEPTSDAFDKNLKTVDFKALYEINKDYVGWIDIPGTKISYPIVRGTDNEYYLNATFEGSYNVSGSIFMDFRNKPDWSSTNTVIYGHRMNDGTMFAGIKSFLDKSYFDSNRFIYIYLENEIHVFEIFSAGEFDIYDPCYTFGFTDSAEYDAWISDLKLRSAQSADVKEPFGRQAITLSTCVAGSETRRHVIQGALVEILLPA